MNNSLRLFLEVIYKKRKKLFSLILITHLGYTLLQTSSGIHGIPLPPFNVISPLLSFFTLAICIVILRFANKSFESKEFVAVIILAGFQSILIIFELRASIIYFLFSLINGSLLSYFLFKNYRLLNLKMRLYSILLLLTVSKFISEYILQDIAIFISLFFNLIFLCTSFIIFKPKSRNDFIPVSIGGAVGFGIAISLSFFTLPYFVANNIINQIFGLQAETIFFIPEFAIFSLYLIIISAGFFSLFFSKKKVYLLMALTGFSLGIHYLILLRFAFLREAVVNCEESNLRS